MNAVVQGKESKIYRLGEKKTKIAFFRDDIIVFVENLKESTERLIHNYSNLAEYKVNIQELITFLYMIRNKWN